jgi:NAD kinase
MCARVRHLDEWQVMDEQESSTTVVTSTSSSSTSYSSSSSTTLVQQQTLMTVIYFIYPHRSYIYVPLFSSIVLFKTFCDFGNGQKSSNVDHHFMGTILKSLQYFYLKRKGGLYNF